MKLPGARRQMFTWPLHGRLGKEMSGLFFFVFYQIMLPIREARRDANRSSAYRNLNKAEHLGCI